MSEMDKKEELLGRITQLTEANSICVRLKKNTRTLDLFETIKFFSQEDKKFLILKNAFYVFSDNAFVQLSLVICSSWMLYYDSPSFSISYLKSKPFSRIELDKIERYNSEKIYPLLRCICEVFPQKINKGTVLPFRTPCMLKAQTHDDRSGFGNEWAGRGSYIIGKKYGDSETPFAIIGTILE